MELDDGILQIQFGSGNAVYNQYFDVQEKKTSEVFGKAAAVKYGKIAFMDYLDGKLVFVVQDLFDRNVLYKEYYFDFSPVAVPYNAVVDATFINANIIEITYYSGADYIEINLLIDLYSTY